MADIMNGRYALADPSSGLTVLSLDGGELNMFGSCTRIRTTQREFYPQIQDEPTKLKVENHIMAQLVTGLVVAAALAAVAVAVVVTGGAALAPLACALGGAAIGAGAVAIGTAVSDSETGYNRSWGDYWQRLITGSSIGFMAGASVYGLIAAVPAAASAAGVQASMMLGTSTFTAVTVPGIVTVGGYGLAGAGAVYTANDIYSNSRGYNIILDKVFDDNIEAYEAAGMVLDLFAEMYTNLGESNRAQGNRSNNDAGQPGEEPPKKPSNTGDNDSAAGETAKENNIKNTVNNDNVKTGTTKDNSVKNPVESDHTAGTTQGNSAKSIIDNKGAETADGDAPHIEIKDKNSKQGVPETDAQEDIKVRKCSYNGDNAADDKDNKKSSANLGKGEESTTDKSSEGIEGGGAEKERKNNKGADEEGIVIEQGNTETSKSKKSANDDKAGVIKATSSKVVRQTIHGFDTTVNEDKQGRHIVGHKRFENGRSIFYGTKDDAQKLVDDFGDTGQWIGTNKERVNFGKVIGQYVDPVTSNAVDTTVGIIHYSKTGTHIVPAQPMS